MGWTGVPDFWSCFFNTPGAWYPIKKGRLKTVDPAPIGRVDDAVRILRTPDWE
jgi:hypothetical protein